MRKELWSLLLCILSISMVSASTTQDPLIWMPASQPSLGITSLALGDDLQPISNGEWCCAVCCQGNDSDNAVSMRTTLNNNGMKVEFLDTMLRSLKWSTFFAVFDDDHEELLQTLTTHLSDFGTGMLYRLVKTTSSGRNSHVMEAIEDTLMRTDTLNGVVACSVRCIKQLLELTLTLESEFKRRLSVVQSTKWILMPTKIGPGDAGLLKEIFAFGFDNIAMMVDPSMLPFPYRMPEEFSCSPITVSTLLWKKGNRRELSPVGHYCTQNGPHVVSDIFPNINFGFNGRNFIVATLPWDPYMMINEVNGTEEFYGLCADLLSELARTLNFTYTWTQPADRLWGSDISGNWTGLVGMLHRQEVDLMVAPLTMSQQREIVMDFTFPFYHDFTSVLLKRPDPNANKWKTYINIFRWQVFLCLGLALLGASVVCITIEAGERSIFGNPHLWIAFNRFWVLVGALLQQGCRQLPRRGSGRLFLSSWWLFAIVVAATYSANLIAFLTVTRDKAPFDTLEEMVKQDEYTYGTMDQSVWTMLFESSTSPTYQAINRNMREFAKDDPRVLSQDPYVHLEKIREGGYAYIADTGLFNNWIATNCDLMLIKEKFYPSKYAVGLPNDSAYTQLFSDQVMKIYESGLLQVMIERWWPKRNFCGGALITEHRVLNLNDLQSVFYVAGLGVGLSAVGLFLEYIIMTVCPGIRRSRRSSSSSTRADVNEGFAMS